MGGTVQEAAHALRELGWSLVPVTRAKKPLTTWRALARTCPTTAQIDGWFRRWPSAGVAVICGSVSGLLVLDADGQRGVDEAEERGVPRTVSTNTPRGGRHYYFRTPGGIGNAAKLGASKSLDVRGDAGYVLAPPSENGRGFYHWRVSPWEATVAPAPTWVLRMMAQRRAIRAGKPPCPTVGPVDIEA